MACLDDARAARLSVRLARSQVSAAVRLVPLGQTAAQRMLAAARWHDPAAARARPTLADDEIGSFAPASPSPARCTKHSTADYFDRESVMIMSISQVFASASAGPSVRARPRSSMRCASAARALQIAVGHQRHLHQGRRGVPGAQPARSRPSASSASRPAAARTPRSAKTRRSTSRPSTRLMRALPRARSDHRRERRRQPRRDVQPRARPTSRST